MTVSRFTCTAALAGAVLLASSLGAAAGEGLAWQGWSSELFKRAKAENRFVLLDLEAVWCHWCHVMEQTTYADAKVQGLMAQRYIPVRVDQDANPDLAARYGDWGWPATIVFAPDGSEIVKLRGYRTPEQMQSLLQAIIDDPSPGPSVFSLPDVTPASTPLLPASRSAELGAAWRESYDAVNAGWGDVHKFVPVEGMDLALALSDAGDKDREREARATLDQGLNLIDPVWGGNYQYSDEADWRSPHFEKIMQFQANGLRQYSAAYARWNDPRYLAAARSIERYLTGFLLSPEGAFYVSQDADLSHTVDGHAFYALDDQGRRKLGMPRIDQHLYARENGWAISGLLGLYNVTGDTTTLATAERAYAWIVSNRALPDGGFRHDTADRGGPYLGDSLAMGQAALDLYGATGKRTYLEVAIGTARFIGTTFKSSAGFATAKAEPASEGVFAKPTVLFDEAVAVARFLNLVYRVSGVEAFKELSEHAGRYLASDVITGVSGYAAGVLTANAELNIDPVHLTVVGPKDSPEAQRLHAAARRMPAVYKRLDWWDPREGAMLNPDVLYPELDTPALFACSNRICSQPVFAAAEIAPVLARMMALRQPAAAP
jgi:uncharacterized protein